MLFEHNKGLYQQIYKHNDIPVFFVLACCCFLPNFKNTKKSLRLKQLKKKSGLKMKEYLLGERSEPHTGVFNRDFA